MVAGVARDVVERLAQFDVGVVAEHLVESRVGYLMRLICPVQSPSRLVRLVPQEPL